MVLGAAGEMGSFRAHLGLVGLVWLCSWQCLVCAMQDYWTDPTHLQCGTKHMMFNLPSLFGDAAFVLTAVDDAGKSHYLYNDSSCGTWVGPKSDGSMVVGAAYDGCYVREQGGDYVMTIILEEVLHNGKTQYHKKDLKCPILQAMDAPSQSVCNSIQQPDRLACGAPSASRELCESVGCCFTPNDVGMPCYYGNSLTAYCTADNNMVVAISKDLSVPSLIMASVGVLGVDSTSCPGLLMSKTDSFASFQFPLKCGNKKQVADKTIYESTLVATKDVMQWGKSSITRDSTIGLTIQCSYSQTGGVPLTVEVHTLPPPLPVSTTGRLLLEMRIAQDVQYSSYYADGDYPITKVLREPVFLEVRILQRSDPSLVLVLNNCWATQTPAPTQDPQWPLLVNRCPFAGDNYLTQRVPLGAPSQNIPFPTHYQRFIVSTFTFVDSSTQAPLNGLVYFQCSASVCIPSATDSCTATCASISKRMVENSPSEENMTVTSYGPVIFNAENDTDSSLNFSRKEQAHLGSSSAMTWLRGSAAVGLILGITIVAIAMYRRRQNGNMITVNT